LSFAFPLLAAYEGLALLLSGFDVAGVRNGADVLLKNVFVAVGGRNGLIVFGVLLVGWGASLIWRDVRINGRIHPRYYPPMLGESVAYALVFGVVAGTLTGVLLPTLVLVEASVAEAAFQFPALSFPAQLMISLGAGIYEELVFRVFLVSGLALLGRRVLGWSSAGAGVFAVVVGALIFAAFHYIGPYGDRWALGSFTFRTIAGVLFSGLYLLRGFGITAWTHALYDVFLAVGV
jgi:hypothetical protein